MRSKLSDGGPVGTAGAGAPAGAARAGGALGSLIDADPAREMAQLLDLQNRQTRRAAHSKAHHAPQTLLSLFGDA
jgi:hypothetical protein